MYWDNGRQAGRCSDLERVTGKPTIVIGDRGAFPGNDYALLSMPHSLSVDRVSADPDTCWNLAPSGMTGSDAALLYLSALERVGPGVVTFRGEVRHVRGRG